MPKPPEHKVNAGIHLFTWADEGITIRLDRLREDSRHMLSGEITIKNAAPGVATHLHQARLNLTSTTSRKQLAGFLFERRADLDWQGIVEQACVLTLLKHREGEPVIEIGQSKPREGITFRLNPFLIEGQANMIYGDGGNGKTETAILWAVCLDQGFVRSDLFGDIEPGHILFLDYESDLYDLQERINAIHRGLGIEESPSGILYRFCSQPLVNDIEEIQRLVIEHTISTVIVDPVGSACGGEPENAEVVLNYFRALRTLRVTTLSIDHVAKGSKLPFGSVYKWNQCRNIFEVKKSQEEGENILSVGIYHKKANNARLQHPKGYQFTFEGERNQSVVKVRSIDVKNIAELEANMTLVPRIRTYLGSVPKATAKEIADAVGRPVNEISPRLTDLKRQNEVVIVDRKGRDWFWALGTNRVENE